MVHLDSHVGCVLDLAVFSWSWDGGVVVVVIVVVVVAGSRW